MRVLSDDARRRVHPALLSWLDGSEPGPELVMDSAGRVTVTLGFGEGPEPGDLPRLLALGIEVEAFDLVTTLSVDRPQLASLVSDPSVLRASPVGRVPKPRPPGVH